MNMAPMPCSVMSLRAFSMRARRSASLIGTTGGACCWNSATLGGSSKSVTEGPTAATPAMVAECLRNARRFIMNPNVEGDQQVMGSARHAPGPVHRFTELEHGATLARPSCYKHV